MNLVIDVGNTRVKAAVFEQDNLICRFNFGKEKLIAEIKNILKKYSVTSSIIANVSFLADKEIQELKEITSLLVLSSETKKSFKNLYATPKTLGIDRIALVFGASLKYHNKNVLIIDAGTCITYDFINSKKEYLGGAISPGIEMRYNSLHHFTAKLPLLEKNVPKNFIGDSTVESINSGIVNGVLQEIEGVICQYKNKYSDLTVVLTGGDTIFLSKQLKSSIFANQNFLLEGLNRILIFNNNQ